ncbi:MAG: hypothetical protein B0D92_03825 [Spirochaeta sp. LUC14_002_19_P3]|nr:MAG: hypothetical protein B0D92_03825 [Spirochaeta sp. LUC14_002_19_P3]
MTTEIKGTHGYTPDEDILKDIDKKMHRLEHVKDCIADLHITLDRDKHGEFSAEANIHFRWGNMGHIKTADHNLHKAVDQLFAKITAKSTKEKDKVQNHEGTLKRYEE